MAGVSAWHYLVTSFPNRLAKVKRTVHEDENGEKYVVSTLTPQENPDIPEQFLVIRA